jgi:hypothetical protein
MQKNSDLNTNREVLLAKTIEQSQNSNLVYLEFSIENFLFDWWNLKQLWRGWKLSWKAHFTQKLKQEEWILILAHLMKLLMIILKTHSSSCLQVPILIHISTIDGSSMAQKLFLKLKTSLIYWENSSVRSSIIHRIKWTQTHRILMNQLKIVKNLLTRQWKLISHQNSAEKWFIRRWQTAK